MGALGSKTPAAGLALHLPEVRPKRLNGHEALVKTLSQTRRSIAEARATLAQTNQSLATSREILERAAQVLRDHDIPPSTSRRSVTGVVKRVRSVG